MKHRFMSDNCLGVMGLSPATSPAGLRAVVRPLVRHWPGTWVWPLVRNLLGRPDTPPEPDAGIPRIGGHVG
jgi:hypothetical protein